MGFKKDDIQNVLSLGYLFLLFLGLAKDAMYYGMVDINIMEYLA